MIPLNNLREDNLRFVDEVLLLLLLLVWYSSPLLQERRRLLLGLLQNVFSDSFLGRREYCIQDGGDGKGKASE